MPFSQLRFYNIKITAKSLGEGARKTIEQIAYGVFEIHKNEAVSYLGVYGISSDKPQEGFFEYLDTNENDIFAVPEWAKNHI